MATQLRLQYDEASAQARVVEGLANDIDTILKTLVQEMDQNLNNSSVWQGASATKFKSTWDNCADTFNDFVNHVKSIQSKIDVAAQETSAFDQQ